MLFRRGKAIPQGRQHRRRGAAREAWQKEERAVGDAGPYECEKGGQRKKRGRGRGTFPSGGKYTGGGKKIVRSGKKILIFPVLSCKI